MKRWTSSIKGESVCNWIKVKSGLRLSMSVHGDKLRGSSWEQSSLMVGETLLGGFRLSLTEV